MTHHHTALVWEPHESMVEAVRAISSEVRARYGDDHTVEQAIDHLLDRWPWLAPFGCTGRADLKEVVAIVKRDKDGYSLTFDFWKTKMRVI